jgi:hypothetical protein
MKKSHQGQRSGQHCGSCSCDQENEDTLHDAMAILALAAILNSLERKGKKSTSRSTTRKGLGIGKR